MARDTMAKVRKRIFRLPCETEGVGKRPLPSFLVLSINPHRLFRGQFGHIYYNKKYACSQTQQ